MVDREAGAARREHERVRGRQVDLLERGEIASGQALDHVARFAHGANVTRCRDDRHVTPGGDLQSRVDSGHFGRSVAVLAPGLARGAYGYDAPKRATKAEGCYEGRDGAGGAVQRLSLIHI